MKIFIMKRFIFVSLFVTFLVATFVTFSLKKIIIMTGSQYISDNSKTRNYPAVRPHQIATCLLKGKYQRAAVLRHWEISVANDPSRYQQLALGLEI
jgi:hypothetical protein